MKTCILTEVRSTEIDAMGHVNNAKYLEYMEWSREDWYNKAGLSFDIISEMNIGTVTVNININYKKEVTLGEKLTISTEPIRQGNTSFVLKHEIHNEKQELVSDALVTSVTINLKTRKSTTLPEELRTQYTS